jgi:hypothetical protein
VRVLLPISVRVSRRHISGAILYLCVCMQTELGYSVIDLLSPSLILATRQRFTTRVLIDRWLSVRYDLNQLLYLSFFPRSSQIVRDSGFFFASHAFTAT